MELTGDYLRGHTDAILLAILEQKDNYGYQINQEIVRMTNHRMVLTEATMYTSFKRLLKEGWITSYWVDGPTIRRKYYSITSTGKEYLRNHRQQWNLAKQLIDGFMKEENHD